MISSAVCTRTQAPRHLARGASAVYGSLSSSPLGLRLSLAGAITYSPSSPRHFSTTPATQLRDFFPPRETKFIQTTPPAWPHPGYTAEEMHSVVPAHREPRGFADWAAWKTVRFARYFMDKATGMDAKQKVDKKHPTTDVVAEKPLTEAQWVRTLDTWNPLHIPVLD